MTFSPGACYEPAEAEQVPRRHLCVARGLLNNNSFLKHGEFMGSNWIQ